MGELMKKGFTLIELMAVVIVLGVLALFVVPTIDKTMKQIREDGYEEQINNIKTAAKNWGADHIPELPAVGEDLYITLLDLKQAGLVDKDITNPKTKEKFPDDLQIKITNDNGKIKYEVVD